MIQTFGRVLAHYAGVPAGACPGGYTCVAGTASDVVPQPMILGQGTTGGDFLCTFSFSLKNDWSYNPGSYSQVMKVTVASP